MIKIDLQVAHTLRRLNAPEFAPLVSALSAALEANLDSLAQAADIDVVRKLQGEAQFLKSFLGSIAQAEALVKKMS